MKLLFETPWLAFRGLANTIYIPTSTGKLVEVDQVDIRIEDMLKDGAIQKYSQFWYATLPNSDLFLTDDGELIEDVLSYIKSDREPIQLPDGWWEYAYGLFDGQNVKAAKYVRHEQGELPQEELDRIAPSHKLIASYESLNVDIRKRFKNVIT